MVNIKHDDPKCRSVIENYDDPKLIKHAPKWLWVLEEFSDPFTFVNKSS